MTFGRAHARRIGFAIVVLVGIWFELSPWGARTTSAVLHVQVVALDYWRTHTDAALDISSRIDPGATPRRPELRPLSPIMAMSLVVIAALVWWESRLPGWAIASSLTALVALFAVSTMMLARGVLVPVAGPGLAIVSGMLGRRALEAFIGFRDRSGRGGGP